MRHGLLDFCAHCIVADQAGAESAGRHDAPGNSDVLDIPSIFAGKNGDFEISLNGRSARGTVSTNGMIRRMSSAPSMSANPMPTRRTVMPAIRGSLASTIGAAVAAGPVGRGRSDSNQPGWCYPGIRGRSGSQ